MVAVAAEAMAVEGSGSRLRRDRIFRLHTVNKQAQIAKWYQQTGTTADLCLDAEHKQSVQWIVTSKMAWLVAGTI